MSTSTSGKSFEQQSVSQRVIAAVAEETGKEPTEVGPLYHVIDPDALDRLFSTVGGGDRAQGHVEFAFAGCDVVVRGSGDVEVTERDVATELSDDSDDHRRVGNYEEA
ncbi:HalOD1 output domain-containing protein [Halorussus pelagicus]|uniref:HalOD1 output domain-containing protein n=1 Tax=Halorussus pelagicus TaxID=2505977 RepID=UPI000FFB3A4B|nr:HalOD1 output domain-containing protein [Halorussus pelagicus]